jgi:hypothetical protein
MIEKQQGTHKRIYTYFMQDIGKHVRPVPISHLYRLLLLEKGQWHDGVAYEPVAEKFSLSVTTSLHATSLHGLDFY